MSIVGRGLPQIILVLGISGGIGGSRVIRGAVIGIKENVYFQAADAVGSSRLRTFMRHVVPNVLPIVIIMFSVSIGGVILALASLGFLGFGLPPGTPDWGGLLSREGRQYMEVAPRLAFWPGLCLTITVFSLNMFGDAVRDLLDPRLRGWRRSSRWQRRHVGLRECACAPPPGRHGRMLGDVHPWRRVEHRRTAVREYDSWRSRQRARSMKCRWKPAGLVPPHRHF